MIPFDFDVYQPTTIEEAIAAFQEASAAVQSPDVRYFSGGTEVVTLARDGKLHPTALIDTKRMEKTRGISRGDGRIRIGACTTLTDIVESNAVPLLAKAANRIADHTVRNSITVGGNITGMLPYREAVLPFLVFDGDVELAGPDGLRTVPISEVFKFRLKLKEGEFVVAFGVPESAAEAPIFYKRRAKDSRVDYPLMTLCGAVVDGDVRFAVSGAFNGPVRSANAEKVVNEALGGNAGDAGQTPGATTDTGNGGSTPADDNSADRWKEAAGRAARAFDLKFRSDFRGTGEYREALLTLGIQEMITAFEDKR